MKLRKEALEAIKTAENQWFFGSSQKYCIVNIPVSASKWSDCEFELGTTGHYVEVRFTRYLIELPGDNGVLEVARVDKSDISELFADDGIFDIVFVRSFR